jgi:predicted oxidoreductase
VDADVIVVGAGLAGLAATHELTRAGKRVALVDQEGPANLEMDDRTRRSVHHRVLQVRIHRSANAVAGFLTRPRARRAGARVE